MSDPITTSWNTDRDATRRSGEATQLHKVLADLIAAESWEIMAARSIARSTARVA